MSQGKLDEATPLYKESLAIRKKVFGEEHPDVAGNLNNIAILMYKQKKFSEAKLCMKQALSIWKKALGPDHPQTKAGEGTLQVILESCT